MASKARVRKDRPNLAIEVNGLFFRNRSGLRSDDSLPHRQTNCDDIGQKEIQNDSTLHFFVPPRKGLLPLSLEMIVEKGPGEQAEIEGGCRQAACVKSS